jgi:hypothetical protein
VLYRRLFAIAVLIMAAACAAVARDLALISNKANSLNTISAVDLVKMCKGQTRSLPDGKPLTFVMRAPSTPEMKMLLEKIYGMSGDEVNELVGAANRGRGIHPAIMVVSSDDDLINKVASIPGAVGVVDVYSINSSVAVLKLAGKLPLEPGYLLHGN